MLSSKLPRLQNLLLSSSVAVYLEVGGWRIFLSMRALNYCGGSVEKKWDLFFTIYSVIPFPCNFLPFLLYSSREAQNAAGAFFFFTGFKSTKEPQRNSYCFSNGRISFIFLVGWNSYFVNVILSFCNGCQWNILSFLSIFSCLLLISVI